MAHDDASGAEVATTGSSAEGHVAPNAGTAVLRSDTFENPGLPPVRHRVTDLDQKKNKRAERTVYTLFYLSIVGSIFAIAAYMAFPMESGDIHAIRENNMFLGIGITLALMGIGLGAVHWAKALMSDEPVIDQRHPQTQPAATQERAVEIFQEANEESGFGRRTLIRNSLIGALVAFPLPAVVLFRGLAPQNENPVELLSHTMWKKGTRLTIDPTGVPIKASDLTLGSSVHVIPEGLNDLHGAEKLNQKAKAAVLLMRLNPNDIKEREERKSWSYDGIIAYSKICTHVGCPVALFEQQTHHLLCPCHQSTFDVSDEAKVIFGPAKRPLPQLPITVDAEGYLIAQSDFHEPVGPSFWERS